MGGLGWKMEGSGLGGAEPLPSMGSGGKMNLTFKSLQFGALLREDNSLIAGLKFRLGYLLKTAARFTKCELIIDNDDKEVE